jgi:chromosome segregation ATPase
MDMFTETPIRPKASVNSIGSAGSSFVGTLRDETDEKKRLEKHNLDLKMKVMYLEENMKKLSSSHHFGQHHHADDVESIEADLSALRLQLEEKEIELEQRNLLLMKAKGAIEGLKSEIARLKVDGSKQTVLEERVQQLKISYELMESELKSNISQLELQLATAREKIHAKDQSLTAADEKTVSVASLSSRIMIMT